MSKIDKHLYNILNTKVDGTIGIKIPSFNKSVAVKLKNRIKNINLYLHSYTMYKNFYYGKLTIFEFIDFAYINGFNGIAINIDTGEERSLRFKTDDEIIQIKKYANSRNLLINIDISSTKKKEFKKALHIAKLLDATNIRFYIRKSGFVSKITNESIPIVKKMAKVAKKNGIKLHLEQHEDLKSHELVKIIKKVNKKNLSLLFDYGNMINANEKPLSALKTMAPFIKHVHIKGVKILKEKNGFGHIGVCEKDDDLPHAKMIFDLLMIGKKKSQVEVFYLEEVSDYYAPAYRFQGESKDAFIEKRTVSITKKDNETSLQKLLEEEKKYACLQIDFIKSLLNKLDTIASIKLIKK